MLTVLLALVVGPPQVAAKGTSFGPATVARSVRLDLDVSLPCDVRNFMIVVAGTPGDPAQETCLLRTADIRRTPCRVVDSADSATPGTTLVLVEQGSRTGMPLPLVAGQSYLVFATPPAEGWLWYRHTLTPGSAGSKAWTSKGPQERLLQEVFRTEATSLPKDLSGGELVVAAALDALESSPESDANLVAELLLKAHVPLERPRERWEELALLRGPVLRLAQIDATAKDMSRRAVTSGLLAAWGVKGSLTALTNCIVQIAETAGPDTRLPGLAVFGYGSAYREAYAPLGPAAPTSREKELPEAAVTTRSPHIRDAILKRIANQDVFDLRQAKLLAAMIGQAAPPSEPQLEEPYSSGIVMALEANRFGRSRWEDFEMPGRSKVTGRPDLNAARKYWRDYYHLPPDSRR